MGYFTNSSVDYGNIVCIACDEYGQQGIWQPPFQIRGDDRHTPLSVVDVGDTHAREGDGTPEDSCQWLRDDADYILRSIQAIVRAVSKGKPVQLRN
jgi:hypothetical protein